MNRAVLGVVVGVGLLMALLGATVFRSAVYAQQTVAPRRVAPERSAATGGGVFAAEGLIVVPGPADGKGQLITVIDSRQRVMSVYRIDAADGKISLRSVRNIHWDLQMSYYNCENPLPPEIRAGLE